VSVKVFNFLWNSAGLIQQRHAVGHDAWRSNCVRVGMTARMRRRNKGVGGVYIHVKKGRGSDQELLDATGSARRVAIPMAVRQVAGGRRKAHEAVAGSRLGTSRRVGARGRKTGKLRSEGGIHSAPCGESLDPPLESTTGRLTTGCAGPFIRGGLKSALPVRHGFCCSDGFLSTSGRSSSTRV